MTIDTVLQVVDCFYGYSFLFGPDTEGDLFCDDIFQYAMHNIRLRSNANPMLESKKPDLPYQPSIYEQDCQNQQAGTKSA